MIMAMSKVDSSFAIWLFTLIIFSSYLAQALVPQSKTFKRTIEGDFDFNQAAEYDASYYFLFGTFPFSLCFYNTSNNAYFLGILMGKDESEDYLRWVWDANRGHTVREGGTLTFGTDGNLVLAEADGRVAWQTATANKGVVDLKLLPNGNLVLLDGRGRFVWQSFEHPSDTLLVGQSLRPSGPNKIVARRSQQDGSDGPYSMVLEGEKLSFYLQSKNSKTPLSYFTNYLSGSPLSQVLFNSTPQTQEKFAYELRYELYVNNLYNNSFELGRANYNATLSMLRLDFDGNLRIYTFYDKVDIRPWEVTYSLFGGRFSVCSLPSTCGSFGVCDGGNCVGCPTPKGLVSWSNRCAPPKLPSCKNGSSASNIDYYKVVDVEHFIEYRTLGPMKMEECRDMCSKDCGCLGFFYWEDTHKCFLAPELLTLHKAYNKAHVAYIKKAK